MSFGGALPGFRKWLGRTSHSSTVLSALPDASVRPSAVNARPWIAPSWPDSAAKRLPVSTSQSSTACPAPPTASVLPSGAKAQGALAASSWTGFPLATSHRFKP